MTEHEWLASKDPAMMLRHLNVTYQPGVISEPNVRPEVRASDRKLRLLACEWYARVFPPNHPVLPVIESARKWAEGEMTREGAISAPGIDQHTRRLWYLFREIDSCFEGLNSLRLYPPHTKAEIADLLRDIVGNPFRPVVLGNVILDGIKKGKGEGPNTFWVDPDLITPQVTTMARAAYEYRPWQKCDRCKGRRYILRRFPDAGTGRETISDDCPDCHGAGGIEDGTLDPFTLAVLADALEEAGCLQEETLPCPECSPYLDNPCPRCDGKKKVHEVGTPYDSDWQVCLTCKDSWKFPAGYRPERDPASGRHEGGWTNCKTCNDGRASAQPGVVCKANPILAHLRSPGPHVRGCWVIDLILGNV